MSNGFTTSRRGFLKAAALPIAAPFISRHSWAEGSPMQKLQYAAIGAGSRGASDINSITRHKQIHMLAAADVDLAPLSKVKEKHTDLATFQDWREMLTSHSEQIDVVSVSTPDHMHGIQAISAMNLGMHAYVQKPLAQSIGECRAMQEAAVRNQVVVQMGTQLASGSHDRMAVALVQQRLIGEIQEAWVFCGKTWGDTKPLPDGSDPVPEGLNWDGWLGVGEERSYLDNYYHPNNWRRRQEYGTGTLGDMGCHIFNAMYRGLALTAPMRVRSTTGVPNQHNWTNSEHVEYEFPATPYTGGELKVTWVSGKRRAPEELTSLIPEGVKYPYGCILKGDEGVLLLRHGNSPLLLGKKNEAEPEPAKLKPIGHHQAFVDAILSGDREPLLSPVEFAAPLTEFILLGNIAMQHSPGWLEWDSKEAKIINNEEANERVHRSYREGWEIMGA